MTDLKFRAVALNSAATFVLNPGVISGAPEAYFTDNVVKGKLDMLDTEKYISSSLPTYISTANEDFLKELSIKFDSFLTVLGVEHVFKEYCDKNNPQPHLFLINQKD